MNNVNSHVISIEDSKQTDISDALLESYLNRFINRLDTWFKQDENGHYRLVKPEHKDYEIVSKNLIRRHLEGKITCAWPSTSPTGMCRWIAWDSDKQDSDLAQIEGLLNTLGLNPLREGLRPGRDGHLWLLLQQPIPAVSARYFDDWIKSTLRIPQGNKSVEFFPKQDNAKIGNGLRGPLGTNLKPEAKKAVGWFEGQPKDLITQLEWLSDLNLDNGTKIVALAEEIRRAKQLEFKPVKLSNTSSGSKGFYIHEFIKAKRRVGDEWVTQCPVCKEEGHDRAQDNLHILNDDSFICMYQEPGKTHNRQAIIRAFHIQNNT